MLNQRYCDNLLISEEEMISEIIGEMIKGENIRISEIVVKTIDGSADHLIALTIVAGTDPLVIGLRTPAIMLST